MSPNNLQIEHLFNGKASPPIYQIYTFTVFYFWMLDYQQ